MSRYIDADELLEQIRKKLGIKSLDYLLEAERQIVDAIQSAPSIDIVRCKECKWFVKHNCTKGRDIDTWRASDDFCSYGQKERASDDNTTDHNYRL